MNRTLLARYNRGLVSHTWIQITYEHQKLEYSKFMSITVFAALCAFVTIMLLLVVYIIFTIRCKNGNSDVHDSRIGLIIAGFVIPLIVTITFVITALIMQRFYHYRIPVGIHGEGVFVVLITCVATSILTIVILLPRIKHKWSD